MPPEWKQLMLRYSTALTPGEKQVIANQMANYYGQWLRTAGPAALEQGEQMLQTLQGKVSPERLAQLRQAFQAAAQPIRQVMTTAQQLAPNVPRAELWRTLIQGWQSFCGGAMNVGRTMMGYGRSMMQAGAGVVGMAAAGASLAWEAIATAVLNAGGWAVIADKILLAMVVAAVAALIIAGVTALFQWGMQARNSRPMQEDPWLKSLERHSVVLPRMQPGRVG